MRDLLHWQWQRQWRHVSTLLVLLLQHAAFAIALRLMWHKFSQAQAAQIQNLSVSHDLLTPLYGIITFLIVLSAPIHALPAWSSARQAHTFIWWQQSREGWQLVASRFLCSVAAQFGFLLPAMGCLLAFIWAAPIDVNQWLTVLVHTLVLLLAVQALTLLISSFFAQLFTNLLLNYTVLAAWIALDLLPAQLGIFGAWSTARNGVIALGDVGYLLAITGAALLLLRQLWWSPRPSRWLWLLPLLLLLVSRLPLPTFSVLPAPERHISSGLQQWLQQQTQNVTVTVVAVDPEHRADYLQQLTALQQWHPRLLIQARHPAELEPTLREQIPASDGLLIQTLQRNDWLALPQPQLATGVIVRLQHLTQLAQAWLVFSEGHGERKIFSDDNRDIGRWSEALKQSGYTLAPFAWSTPQLPDNTRVLILAHLQSPMLPAEQRAVLDYVDNGGHLLWLRDPDDAAWPELESRLGVIKLAGTVLDHDGVKRGTPHPAIALVDRYAAHDSVSAISTLSALPWATALQITDSPFTATPLLFSSANAVLQTREPFDTIDSQLPRNQYVLGVALERQLTQHTQRVIVIGDSHFAANTAIDNYGNQALALNTVRWLALADAAPPLPEFFAADAVLLPTTLQTFSLRWLLPIGLPLLLLSVIGYRQWRWRQRA